MSKCNSIRRSAPVACAWTLLVVTTSLYFVFPCPYLTSEYHIAVPICQAVITVFVVVNFSLATFMDPGIIPKAIPDEDKEDDFRAPLYKNVKINGITVRMKWCVTCQFYRPPRCSHCGVCDGCIEIFDHHCPWINNCIGRRNYRFFFLFLVFLCVHMICMFSLCILYTLKHQDQIQHRNTIVTLVIIVIIALLFIPILGLTGFHVILVMRGRTTNEQVTGKFQNGLNPFSRGCFRNMCFTLCGPLYPSHRLRGKTKPRSCAPPSVSARTGENQVRVYMDERSTASAAYSKMSRGAGDFSDVDAMLDSFERPSPSLPRPLRGLVPPKTNNFFSEGGRATILPQGKPWSPYGSAGPPTPRAPRASIPTDAMTRTPEGLPPWAVVPPPRSLTSPVVGPLTPGQSPAATKRHQGASRHALRSSARSMSPNRKFASESELARADRANGNYEARANQTADNIRELAGRPWEERARSAVHVVARYASPWREGRRTPPQELSPNRSIVKALELSECSGARSEGPRGVVDLEARGDLEERRSLYEMNYEISV